jgi:4'-phosphopantetheinyl transferase
MQNLKNPLYKLEEKEVHIWSADLRKTGCDTTHFEDLLSPAEIRRAEKYYFDKDRIAYIKRRGILRNLLGSYTGQAPSSVCLSIGLKGKPELTNKNKFSLTFNVTFSGGMALYAFAPGIPVGIDLERMRPEVEMEAIIENFFSKKEMRTFFSLPEDRKREAFFKGWTRKEAFVKAKGIGIYYGFGYFSVSMKPDEPAALLELEDGETERRQWSLIDIKTVPGFKAALAVRCKSPRILSFNHPKDSFL